MKKTILSLLLCAALLVTALCPAVAEENAADTLLLTELTEWADRYQTRAIAATPLNTPAESLTEDGYEFIYDFATLYADSPVMSQDTLVNAIVLTSEEEEGPRGTSVDDAASVIFAAYYQENEDLRGTEETAVLYSIDLLPESLQWGQVQRDGQRLETIQYAVHDQLTTGGDGYTDAGVIYTMQNGFVGAIRVYGLNARIEERQVYDVLTALRDAALQDAYAQVPFSFDGASLAKFSAEDLIFSGLDFLDLTPEAAAERLGQPMDDLWLDDGENGQIRTMTFDDCEITFTYNADKTACKVYMLMLTADGLEGPRAVRMGDAFSDVFNRFRNGEGEFDGMDGELLYGSEASGEFGAAEYGVDASATLRYGLVLESGDHVILHLHFAPGTMLLDEAMLYIAE